MKEHYIENRRKLAAKLQPGSLALVLANDSMPTNADGTYRYKPNNNLYYLTGIEQEESILLLCPDYFRPHQREILFIKENDPLTEKWHGRRHSKEEAAEISGISNVMYLEDFKATLHFMLSFCEQVYVDVNDHARAALTVETRDKRTANWLRHEYPMHTYHNLSPLLARQRSIKQPYEIELMLEAARITGDGFERILRKMYPGMMEYQVEAELTHEYLMQGGRLADYEPIVASGADACILHYVRNNKPCADGELVLIDAAASYRNYNADMTRTIPVNGRYTARQREVYEAVLRVHRQARTLLIPGNYLDQVQQEVVKMMGEELERLGLLTAQESTDPSQIARYFYHGNSHFLGLSVHDVGFFSEPLQAGMVLTNEPGIYIKEEGIGIRLENNILLTDQGNTDLMATVPIEPDEIEDRMNSQE